jgi:hypothetical protein
MNEAKFRLIICTLLWLTMSATASAQNKTIMVAGRAVDERGAPVSNAVTTFYYPPCRDCIDQLLPVGFSLPDGVFFIEATHNSGRDLKLFIEERTPTGFFNPFGSPPFNNLSELPLFRGFPINLPKRTRESYVRADLGDVLVRPHARN